MMSLNFDERQKALRTLEDSLTPAEIAKLLQGSDRATLPFAITPLLEAGEVPSSYVRECWSEDSDYYSAHVGAQRLIVAFCGGRNRLGVSTSFFLQMLRSDLYDVIILKDPRLLHFDRGIRGLSNSFLGTVQRINTLIAGKSFKETITFGASMGGLPALRAGLLLNANRAISIGGRFCWHAGRLSRKGETVRAFDPLCHCYVNSELEMIAIVARWKRDDIKDLEVLSHLFPKTRTVTVDTDQHNVTGYFYRAKLLRLFYASLFEYWDRGLGPELLSLIDQAAHHINADLVHLRNVREDRARLQLTLGNNRTRLKRKIQTVKQKGAARAKKFETFRQKSGERLQKSGERLQKLMQALLQSRAKLKNSSLIFLLVLRRIAQSERTVIRAIRKRVTHTA